MCGAALGALACTPLAAYNSPLPADDPMLDSAAWVWYNRST